MNSPSRSGVFSAQADRRVEQFTESISYDHRLYAQDIAASIAHANMLAAQAHLTNAEASRMVTALRDIEASIAAGNWEPKIELEDIHMHVETMLIERVGDLGRKLHTARSRNDQVSTDLRLWVRQAIDQMREALCEVQRAFVERGDADLEVVLPAYTHLQRAQPVLATHYWLAYCEKFERDRERLADTRRRANVCPLGTAAVAGTSLPIDRQQVAQELGFDAPTANSLDSSSDRDFVVEFAFDLTLVACHLSTLAEEWILWSTAEFGFIELPQSFCTGSSIMPQKINPDVLELIRGKSARAIGNLQTLLVLIKGLPLAYNRDLQEDKPPLFDSFDQVRASCQLLAPMVRGMRFRQENIRSRLEQGYLDATTLMEYFIKRGVAQRVAHHQVGQIVRYAMQQGKQLNQLTLDELNAWGAGADDSIFDVLGVDQALQAFMSYGSTARFQVTEQLASWKTRLVGRDASNQPVQD